MAQVSKYRYLLNQYPETVQKEQFRIICHISKRTARYLLQSGLVPCVQSGSAGKSTPKNTNFPPAHIAGHTQSSPCFPNL